MALSAAPLLRTLAAAAALAGSALMPAQAGLVVSTWDPPFGSFLPDLSWQLRAELLVPQACLNQPDDTYGTGSGPCAMANITVQHVYLGLFDTAVPSTVYTLDMNYGTGYGVSRLRIVSGQVAGFEAGWIDYLPSLVLTPAYYLTDFGTFSLPPSAEGNYFGLTFGINGPVLECAHCRQHLADEADVGPSVFAGTAGLRQLFITYQDDLGTIPTFSDSNGDPLGVRLDERGRVLGLSATIDGPLQPLPDSRVPLPSVPALLLAAGVAAGLVRRRTP